ncbi:MAG: hypothetical protein AAF828_08480 [Bacteroidota bacterium]
MFGVHGAVEEDDLTDDLFFSQRLELVEVMDLDDGSGYAGRAGTDTIP